jgi:hypothetical protein
MRVYTYDLIIKRFSLIGISVCDWYFFMQFSSSTLNYGFVALLRNNFIANHVVEKVERMSLTSMHFARTKSEKLDAPIRFLTGFHPLLHLVKFSSEFRRLMDGTVMQALLQLAWSGSHCSPPSSFWISYRNSSRDLKAIVRNLDAQQRHGREVGIKKNHD